MLCHPSRRQLGAVLFAIAGLISHTHNAAAVTIQLGGNRHGLHGLAAGQANGGNFQMSLAAGPAGAVFNENSVSTLGVDSRGVPSAVDVGDKFGPDKINILGGNAGVAGTPEAVTFSFNRNGIHRDLLLDGVKDETLEYASLKLPDGSVLSLFDFEVELRLTQQGFTLAQLTVPGVTMLAGADDDALGLHIPFQAGDEFVLSYGEVPYAQGYVPLTPNQPPNGMRWQGLVVVPEPAGAAIGLSASLALLISRRTRRTEPRRPA